MLWISRISGLPGSIPASFSIGMRRSPNASNCSRESQISLTTNLPSDLKATWYSSPSGSQSPDFSSWRMVSSYCSAVTWDVGVKRARMLVFRASMTGAADGLVVAIDGLLRVDAPDRADLQPNTSYRVAWRARILSQKARTNISPISTPRTPTVRQYSRTLAQASDALLVEREPASLVCYAVGGCHVVVGAEHELAHVGGEDHEAEVSCLGLTGVDRARADVRRRRRAVTGGQILLSQRAYAALEEHIEANVVGDLDIKGFSQPIKDELLRLR